MSKPTRPPLPDLTDQDLEEIFGKAVKPPDLPSSVYKLSRIPRETLDAMPYVERQWSCACKDCQRVTTVRDYGHPTHFYWHRKWTNRQSFYLCGRHMKQARAWTSMIYYYSDKLPFELRSKEEAMALLGHKPVNFKA